MKQNYPMYNDGFVSTINYEKLIKMQSQEPCSYSCNSIVINFVNKHKKEREKT